MQYAESYYVFVVFLQTRHGFHGFPLVLYTRFLARILMGTQSMALFEGIDLKNSQFTLKTGILPELASNPYA